MKGKEEIAMNGRHWAANVKTNTRLADVLGISAIAVFGLGFCSWATFAPIASAAIVPGVVAAAGQNLRIQHLEGGIVDQVLVHEGERVHQDQPLFRLASTAAEAQHNRLKKHLVSMQARVARLEAERDNNNRLTFSPELQETAEQIGLSSTIQAQGQEYHARLERHLQELTILGQRKRALGEQVTGMTAQLLAARQQLEVVREEAARKKALLEQGLTNRSEYTNLLRSEADLLAQEAQANAGMLSAKIQITEADEQIARARTQRIERAATELNEIRTQIDDTEEQLTAAAAILERLVVRAPSDGLVVRIGPNSRGSVVRAGDTLLELLPTGENLIVEAQVSPSDIDALSVGQSATLQFSALNRRVTPSVDATVFYVSADRLTNEKTGQPFYTARLRIADQLPPEITRDDIYPGMMVETFVNTGERTFFGYLAKPIVDSFNRAFREE